MSTSPAPAPSFEQALAELETLVRQLEDGQLELASLIEHYERGTALLRHCEKRLRETELKIEQLKSGGAHPALAPFDTTRA